MFLIGDDKGGTAIIVNRQLKCLNFHNEKICLEKCQNVVFVTRFSNIAIFDAFFLIFFVKYNFGQTSDH